MWRGRGRPLNRFRSFNYSSVSIHDDSKALTENSTGPPPSYPEVRNLPPLPEIDDPTFKLLDRWHKLRHAYRSGPYFLRNEDESVNRSKDPFAVKRYSDKEVRKTERPPLSAVLTLSSDIFPEELSSQKQKKDSSNFAESSKTVETFWLDRLADSKDMDRFESLAKKTELERDETDNENEEFVNENEDDVYSGDDYQQGEHFDDDEEYEDYEEAGDDGPVY